MDQRDLFNTPTQDQRQQLKDAELAMWKWDMGGKRPSQRTRILASLAQPTWVCGSTWLDRRMPRYAAVIHTLRAEGWDIASEPCPEHGTHRYGLGSLR